MGQRGVCWELPLRPRSHLRKRTCGCGIECGVMMGFKMRTLGCRLDTL